MEKLFKEERFKAFQKKRSELENVMDISDDEEWQEQQKVQSYSLIDIRFSVLFKFYKTLVSLLFYFFVCRSLQW
jgi:hypothetical protein